MKLGRKQLQKMKKRSEGSRGWFQYLYLRIETKGPWCSLCSESTKDLLIQAFVGFQVSGKGRKRSNYFGRTCFTTRIPVGLPTTIGSIQKSGSSLILAALLNIHHTPRFSISQWDEKNWHLLATNWQGCQLVRLALRRLANPPLAPPPYSWRNSHNLIKHASRHLLGA